MPNNTNIHGSHQEIHIGKFTRDRTGIVTGSVQRHRQEPFDSIDWTYLNKLAAPSGPTINKGVPCVNVERTYDNANVMAIYTYSYEGIDDGYNFSDAEVVYELDITMGEDPIQTHNNFAAIAKKYGWLAGKRQFQQFLPVDPTATGGLGGGGGLGGNQSSKFKRNPLYGTDSYLAVGGHYRIIYAARLVPESATSQINEIVKNPPGIENFVLPGWAQKRNWLCLGPHATLRGNVGQISEEYLLSGPRGWNPDIYGAGKLGGSTQAQTTT